MTVVRSHSDLLGIAAERSDMVLDPSESFTFWEYAVRVGPCKAMRELTIVETEVSDTSFFHLLPT